MVSRERADQRSGGHIRTLSGTPQAIESKLVRGTKVTVMKSPEEFEAGNSVESLWRLGYANRRYWFVEAQWRNLNIQEVNRERTGIRAAKLDVAHQDATAGDASLFLKDQFKDRLARAGAGIRYQPTGAVLAARQAERDFDGWAITLKGPSRCRH